MVKKISSCVVAFFVLAVLYHALTFVFTGVDLLADPDGDRWLLLSLLTFASIVVRVIVNIVESCD